MDRIIKKYLFDISTAIDNIENYIGNPKVFADYEKNRQLQQAVERNLEIIGEATKRMLEIDPNINITNARKKSVQEIELFTDTTILIILKYGVSLSTVCLF